jgi:hypothetical protein
VSGGMAHGDGALVDLGGAPGGTQASFPRELTNAGLGTFNATTVTLERGVFTTTLQAPFALGSGETVAIELGAPMGAAGSEVTDVLVLGGPPDSGCEASVQRFGLRARAE